MKNKIYALSIMLIVLISLSAVFVNALPTASAGSDGYGFIGYGLTVGLDASGSTGDDLSYTWTCKTGTADEVVLGTDMTIYPEWNLWKQCCAGTECQLDEIFQIDLEVLDIHGDIASDQLNMQVKEFPFALIESDMTATEFAPGEYSGSAVLSNGNSILENYFTGTDFSQKTLTPVVSKCTLTNADIVVDQATGDVSITATEGQCKWNLLGLGTETIYCDSWIASMIILAMKEAQQNTAYRPFTADNFGDLVININAAEEETVPVTHLELSGEIAQIDETTLLDQVYTIDNFAFQGQLPGIMLDSASGVELYIHWKNNEFVLEDAELSNVIVDPVNADGLKPVTSAGVTINSADVNTLPGITATFSGLIGVGDLLEPILNQAPVVDLKSSSVTRGHSLIQGEDLVLDASGTYDPEGEEMTYLYRCNDCTTVLASGTGLDVATIPYEGGWDQCTPMDNRGFDNICVKVTDSAGNEAVTTAPVLFNIPIGQVITGGQIQDGAKLDYSFSSSIVDEGGEIGERMYTYFDLKAEEQYLENSVFESKDFFGYKLGGFADFFRRRDPQNIDSRAMVNAVDYLKDRFNLKKDKEENLSDTMENALTELSVLASPLTKSKLSLTNTMLPGLPAVYAGTDTIALLEKEELPATGSVSSWHIPNKDLLKFSWSIFTEQEDVTVAERAHRAAEVLSEISNVIDDTSADNSFTYTVVSNSGVVTQIEAAGAGALTSVIDQLNDITSAEPYSEENFDGEGGEIDDMDLYLEIIKMYMEVCLISNKSCPGI